MKNNDVVILAAKRSPFGKFGGTLKDWSPAELAVPLIQGIVYATNDKGCTYSTIRNLVDRIILGNVYSAGEGQHVVRQAAVLAGLSEKRCRSYRIERVCTSSLQALWAAYLHVCESDELVIAGGMESMSRAPFLLKRSDRAGLSLTKDDPDPFIDSLLYDGLCDGLLEGHPHMGELADKFAKTNLIGREEQDEYAFQSYCRAYEANKLKPETLGILDNGDYPIQLDESVVSPNLERLRQSAAVFGETITAGNASKRSDGAAVLLISRYGWAKQLGIKPLARIIAFGEDVTENERFLEAPVGATFDALGRAGMLLSDVDLLEVHEPFAVGAVRYVRFFKGAGLYQISNLEDRMNVWGGSIAIGHPLGATGARLVVTLVHALKYHGKRYGLATACNGGGEAVAVIIENLQK